jgi:hypothetical protein
MAIEGNTIRLLRDWNDSETLEVLYVPNAETLIHDGSTSSATPSTIVLDESPTTGSLDTRANAYEGYLVRVLTSTEGYVQERYISGYDNTTRTATVNVDFDPDPTGTLTYEVLPAYSNMVKEVVILKVARSILSGESDPQRRHLLTRELQEKVRTLRMSVQHRIARFPNHFIGDTGDNALRGHWSASFGL